MSPIENTTPIETTASIIRTVEERNVRPAGVAVHLMLHQPKWFQRRYTIMVQNVKANIPKDWVIQIFYTGEGTSLDGINGNLGLKSMIERGEVQLTLLPKELIKKRRIELMVTPWFWENLLADRALIFGGNSVICSNSPLNISYFDQWDYIGAPWTLFNGVGGEGGISIRNRHTMLKVLENERNKLPEEKRASAFKNLGQEDQFFVSRIIAMNKGGDTIAIAPRIVTQQFGGSGHFYNDHVWAIADTLAGLPFDDRDKFMNLCPEMKILFPSLHDPNCFGASPNGEKCAVNICALHPKPGGC